MRMENAWVSPLQKAGGTRARASAVLPTEVETHAHTNSIIWRVMTGQLFVCCGATTSRSSLCLRDKMEFFFFFRGRKKKHQDCLVILKEGGKSGRRDFFKKWKTTKNQPSG